MTPILAMILALLAGSAGMQEWAPSRTVRIIVPVIGGTNELVARLVAPKLQDLFNQPFVVENKAGAGGNIGVDFVAKSPEVRDKLTAVEFEMVGSTPEQFRDWIAKEIPRWAAVIRQTGARAN